MIQGANGNPLIWLALFASLSLGATFASTRHIFDAPRQVVARVLAPVQTGASRVGHAFRDVAADWQDLGRLRTENAALRQSVDELVQETIHLRAAELENRELRDQLKYTRENAGRSLRPLQVIGLDSSSLLGHIVLNQGTEGGIQDGMTVVSTAGLVGRVVNLTARTSTVLLITHPSSTVNVVIQGAPGASGVLNGQPDGRMRMRYIPQSEPVKVNDLVVTSGKGGLFPKDLPVGRVVHVASRDIDIFQDALVEPFVNVRKLSSVLVDVGFIPTKL